VVETEINAAVLATFGEAVTVTRAGEPDWEGRGIFDYRHYEADLGVRVVSDTETTVGLLQSQVGTVEQGDGVTARGRTYRVQSTRPDGGGMIVLVLEAS